MEKTYFDERRLDSENKIKQLLFELPEFAEDFFVGIETTTSPLTRLGYARDLLIEHNLRLVVYVAKRYDTAQNGGIEDLISIGTIGLVKAINTFKSDKNIKLATYASRCIENEILMFLRKNNKLRHEISLDEPLNIDYDGNELLLSDIIGTDSDIVKNELEQSDQKTMFYEAFKDLSKREKEILMFRYGLMNYDELTQKDVAKMMGISQSYISRLEKKIIKKLRNKLNYNEIK